MSAILYPIGGAIAGFFAGAIFANYILGDSKKNKHNNYGSLFLDIVFNCAIALTCVSLGTAGGTIAGSLFFATR